METPRDAEPDHEGFLVGTCRTRHSVIFDMGSPYLSIPDIPRVSGTITVIWSNCSDFFKAEVSDTVCFQQTWNNFYNFPSRRSCFEPALWNETMMSCFSTL